MADNIKGLSIEIGGDTSKLQQAMSQVDRSIKTTQSSLKDINKLLKFDDGSHSAELLAQKQQALSKVIEDCKTKVEALKQAQENMKAEGIDENSEQYQQLERQIIMAEQQMQNYQGQLDETTAALDGTTDAADNTGNAIEQEGNSADSASDKTGKFVDVLGTVGAATAAAIAGLAGLAKGFIEAAGSTAEYGDNIDKMSQKLGISATAYQEWEAIAQHSGTSMESLKTSFKTLANAADDGKDAFERLGMNLEEVKKMSTEDLFAATISALQDMEEGTERTAIASDLLGKGATELGALLNTSAEDTEAMRQAVHDLGGVMSDEAIKDAARYQDSLQDMETAFSGLKNNIVSEFLPAMADVMDGISAIFSGQEGGTEMITKALDTISQKIQQAMPNILSMILKGVGMIGQTLASSLPSILNTITSMIPQLMTIITSITDVLLQNLPLFMQAGISLLAAIIEGILSQIPQLIDVALQIAQGLLDYVMENAPELMEGGMAMLEEIVNGILDNLPEIIDAVTTMINTFLEYCLSHLPEIMQMGMEILMKVAEGILNNLPQIVTAVAQMIITFTTTIIEHLPEILKNGIEIIGQLVAGIIQAIPQVVDGIKQVIQNIIDTLKEKWEDFKEAGRNIINGIRDGIVEAASSVVDAVKDVAQDAWDAVTGFFDINSPSRLMRDYVGKNIDLGWAEGIDKYSDTVSKAIKGVSDGVMEALSNPVSANYAANINKQATIYLTSPVYLDGKFMTSYVNQSLGVML